jgi:hypothetical protein
MRKLFFLVIAGAIFISCNNSKQGGEGEKTKSDTSATTNNAAMPPAENPLKKLLGSFVGAFGDNKITLLVVKAEGDSILGRSVVGGNDRPFAGTFTQDDVQFVVDAKEPGDDKYDGVFHFSMEKGNPNALNGSWKPNDPKQKSKEFVLQRKVFEYKTDVGSFPEASQRLLTAKDVENMMKEDLEYMRNEIFARHGFCFKKKELRQMFEMEEWYVPDNVVIKDRLTDIEKKNIALIKRYEKYAEEYGDEYGR